MFLRVVRSELEKGIIPFETDIRLGRTSTICVGLVQRETFSWMEAWKVFPFADVDIQHNLVSFPTYSMLSKISKLTPDENPGREHLHIAFAAAVYTARRFTNGVQINFALIFSLLPFTSEKVKTQQQHHITLHISPLHDLDLTKQSA